MDVTTDGDWCFDWLNVALLYQDLLDFLAEEAELTFRQDGSFLYRLKPVVDVGLAHFCLELLML